MVDENRPVMNLEITANEIRVVTPNPGGKDEALGIMSRAEALAKAKELGGLDLILINNNSDPPVCKIVDYSKYRYTQEKKAKEVKKNSKASEVKEIKMSYKIDVHDYDVRIKSASKFLKQGNRVKCTVMFRGREVQHDNLGFELLERLSTELDDVSLREGKAKREGRNRSLMLSPRPDVMKAISDSRRAEEKAKKKKREQEKALELEQKKDKADESAQNAQNSALDDLLNSDS
jgi:translation initiation factor IF-3